MRPWLIILGTGLALIGLQAAQAQVTIDITKITCNQFLGSAITDPHTLGVWPNGYVNGERGKKIIDPLFPGHISLGHYCQSHMDALLLDAARNAFSVPTNNLPNEETDNQLFAE
jgi:acid stress chaperone HdeB